jgi:hypothetical protein
MKATTFLLLAATLSGCATSDQPFTPAQVGSGHILTAIIIGFGASAQAAKSDNARLVASVGLPCRVLTQVTVQVETNPELWDTRTEVQFLMTAKAEALPTKPFMDPAKPLL